MSEAYDRLMANLEEDEGAFPMFARCARRQWAGLTPQERNSIDRMWHAGRTPMLRSMHEKAAIPIWIVPRPWPSPGPMVLMSIKCDAP